MKKLFRNLLVLSVISSVAFTSCKTDDPLAPDPVAPTLSINGGAIADNQSSQVDAISISIIASADTDRKISKLSITRTVTGLKPSNNSILSKSYAAKDVIYTHIDSIKVAGLELSDGDKIAYFVTAEDDKGLTTQKTYTVTITSIASKIQVLLGAPANTTNEYRFLGVAEDFKAYRAGSTGADLARDNVSKIDFIYFYNSAGSVLNALYSPDFPFTPGSGWHTEVSSWTGTKNTTMYKETQMTISEYNGLAGQQFFTELDAIDFNSGTTNRVANIQTQTVLAYKLNNGKRGFLAIIGVAANDKGVITLASKVEL